MKCRQCGAALADGDLFCSECGAHSAYVHGGADAAHPPATPTCSATNKPRGQSVAIIAAAACVAALMAIGVGYGVYTYVKGRHTLTIVPETAQRPSASEAFLGYVPEFASEPIRAAYDRFFGTPEWSAGDHNGRSIVSFMGVVNYRGEDRPILMIFDVTEYARGGEMKMELAGMQFRDTKEAISGDLADRIMRAPFEAR